MQNHEKRIPMLRTSFPIALVAIAVLLASCTTAYVPATLNVPLMRNAGEVRVYADPYINVQASYAITDEIGVLASGHIVQERVNDNDSGRTISNGSGNQFEVGIGYTRILLRDVIITADAIGELYVGGGFGGLKLHNKDDNNNYEVSATKFFIQPSIGLSHRYLEVAFTPRFVALMYGEPTTDYTDSELNLKSLPDRTGPMHWFAEPSITVRGGIQEVKAQFQIGQAFHLNTTPLAHETLILRLGVQVNFGRKDNRTPMATP